jgi:hypothetical protein
MDAGGSSRYISSRMRLSPGSAGKLVLVYLLGGVAFAAGTFLTLFLSFFVWGTDPAFDSGLGERVFGLIPVAGGAMLAGFMLYGLLRERLGVRLKVGQFWIMSGVTWLAMALAQISAGPRGLFGEPEIVTFVAMAISVAIGLGAGVWLGGAPKEPPT